MAKAPGKSEKPRFHEVHLVSKRARETLEQASKHLEDHTAVGAVARGQTFEMASYLDQAEDSYQDALAFDDSFDEALARLVIVQIKSNRAEKALENAMKLAARNPAFAVREMTSDEHVGAMTLLGDALVLNGRHEDAIHAYQKARGLDANDSFAAGRLAQLHLAAGRPVKAIEQAGYFVSNPRFHSLSIAMGLGRTNEALLPKFSVGALTQMVMRGSVGRPLLIDGAPHVAPLSIDSATAEPWCGDVTDDEILAR